jgi:hypothetical protein
MPLCASSACSASVPRPHPSFGGQRYVTAGFDGSRFPSAPNWRMETGTRPPHALHNGTTKRDGASPVFTGVRVPSRNFTLVKHRGLPARSGMFSNQRPVTRLPLSLPARQVRTRPENRRAREWAGGPGAGHTEDRQKTPHFLNGLRALGALSCLPSCSPGIEDSRRVSTISI